MMRKRSRQAGHTCHLFTPRENGSQLIPAQHAGLSRGDASLFDLNPDGENLMDSEFTERESRLFGLSDPRCARAG